VSLDHLIQAASNLPIDASALESSISALESDIKALELSSVPWESALPWITALVVIGVGMELWVISHERHDEKEIWNAWYFGRIRPPGRPSKTKLLIEVVSVLLVTLGVAGEIGVGVKITSINGRLRNKNAEFRIENGHLIALLDKEAQKLHKDAEDEHLRRVELEREIQPRRLDNPEQFVDALKRIAPAVKGRAVGISSGMFDVEAALLCMQIQATFIDAGIRPDISRAGQLIQPGMPAVGIRVLGLPADKQFMDNLAKSLSAQVGEPVTVDAAPNHTRLDVWVGAKPVPGVSKAGWP
jgi:hypothetical protein